VTVAITVDGRATFFNYGVASRETSAPVSTSTIFELGSVSKIFTATLALYVQELGKLSLADHPARFMRELKGAAVDKVSLLNLGTYTAGGLPLQFPDGVSDDKSVVRYFRTWKADAEPGEPARRARIVRCASKLLVIHRQDAAMRSSSARSVGRGGVPPTAPQRQSERLRNALITGPDKQVRFARSERG